MEKVEKALSGTVIWFRGAFGFIQQDNGQRDMFVHFSDITSTDGGYRTLQKGMRVEYKVGLNVRGEDKAIDVCILPDQKRAATTA